MSHLKSVPEYATEEPIRRSIDKKQKNYKLKDDREREKALRSGSKKVKSQKDRQLEDLNETL